MKLDSYKLMGIVLIGNGKEFKCWNVFLKTRVWEFIFEMNLKLQFKKYFKKIILIFKFLNSKNKINLHSKTYKTNFIFQKNPLNFKNKY